MTAIEEQAKTPHGERGVALIIALLAITLLMGVGFALMLSSSTESMIHSSFRRDSLALFAARGGLEEARGRLGPDAKPATTNPLTSVKIPPCDPVSPCPVANLTPGDAYYIQLNTSITPTTACTYLGMSCTDPSPPTGTVTYFATNPQGTPMPSVWVKIELATETNLNRDVDGVGGVTNAQVYWDIRNLTTTAGNPANPAYILTSLSIVPGRATRTLREIVAVGMLPAVPGPLTLDGFPGVYIPPTSNPFTLSGCDAAASPPPCNTAPPHAPSVVVPTATDVTAAQALIPDGVGVNRNGNYPGVTNNGCSGNNCGNSTVDTASVAAADDASIFPTNPLSSNYFFSSCTGVQDLQEYISAAADFTYNGNASSLATPGSFNNNNAIINVINGDATLAQNDMRPSPSDRGFGILLVTGNLTISGSSDYNGMIIVLGGTMFVSGGGGGLVQGGIFVANTTTCPTSLGPVTFDPSGGGNFTIQYDTRYTNPGNGWLPYQILSFNY